MPTPIRRAIASLLVLPLLVWSCVGQDEEGGGDAVRAPAGDQPAARPGEPPAPPGGVSRGTLGTIRATVDGQERTWYVVSGPIAGERQATGGWIEVSTGTRGIALGGFDREDVALDGFTWNADGMLSGYGDYSGSLLTLMLYVEGEPSSLEVRFPPEPGQTYAVAFMPRATANDLSQVHLLADGVLRVSELRFSGDAIALEGTFSGTFRTMDGGRSVQITNGRFQAAGLERLRPVARR